MKGVHVFKDLCLILLVLFLSNNLHADEREKLFSLHKDIILLNLINGLYLTPEQTASLIEKIEEAEVVRADFLQSIDHHKNDIENVLKNVRQELLNGEQIEEDLKKRVHKMKEIQHQLEDEQGEKLHLIETDLKTVLTPNQLIVIEEYKPCTIPPARGKIGQSEDVSAQGISRLLTRIRRMPRDRYELLNDMFIDRHIEKIERRLGVMTDEEKLSVKKKMLAGFERARTLSDQEYLIEKTELARRLLPDDRKNKILRKNDLGKLGHFMLNPALLPLLKKMVRQK